MTAREAVHNDPVWRDRSNFIFAADISSYSLAADTEQLWGRRISDCVFQVCCIPFFVYDLALGDLVETEFAMNSPYMLKRVVEPSGRYVFRAWFGDSNQAPDEVTLKLRGLGGLLEWSSSNLLAIDAADENIAKLIAQCLQVFEDDGILVFETGRTG